MAGATLRHALRHVGTWIGSQKGEATPDQVLLARFLAQRDEAAFAALMERHGAMVLGVCQRVLGNVHDAEDASQAVFLVLARKAGSVRKAGSLASWLHGVARRVAGKLQTSLARRSGRETVAAAEKPAVCEPADLSWREVLRLVDEELTRLPTAYRTPLVLCHLEGRTQDEAARELGWTVGALRGRLQRGRDMLRARLTRRGVTGASALAVAALVPNLGSAALPPALASSTAQASVPMAAGEAVPGLPAPIAALTREVLRSLWLGSLAKAACMAVVVLGSILALFALRARTDGPRSEDPPARGTYSTIAAPAAPETWWEARRFQSPNTHAWTVAFSPEGKRIAAGTGGVVPTPGSLKVWDLDTGAVQFALDTDRSVRCVVFSPDGKTLATAEHDGAARVRDAGNGDVLCTLRGHTSNLDSVAYSADGKTLATSSWDATVKLWNAGSGAEIKTLVAHKGQAFTAAFGRTDGLLAAGYANGTASIWQTGNGATLDVVRAHDAPVHWVALAPPDDKVLATASWDKLVKLWDARTGKALATLRGHTSTVLAVAFSPDGKGLASAAGPWGTVATANGASPGEVIVWDLARSKAVACLPHNDRVFGVAFSPDGNTLATACWDGNITLWRRGPAAEKPTPRPPHDKAPRVEDVQFVLAAQPGGDAAEEPVPKAKKSYAEDYHAALKRDKGDIPGLTLYGPDAADCVKATPDGLRITLPPDHPRRRAGTGVVTDFGVKGDFEITLAYKILQEPIPGLTGRPTDLALVVVPDDRPKPETWQKTNQNRASLSREFLGPQKSSRFHAEATQWNNENVPRDKWGNEQVERIESHVPRVAPAEGTEGRLRLVRSGARLFYYTSEEPNKDFNLLFQSEFGTKDLKNVRVLSSTEWVGVSFDAVVTDLQIRADAFVKKVESPAPPPAPESRRHWWVAALALGGLFMVVVLAAAVGLFVYTRRRIAPTLKTTGGGNESAFVFACPRCGKRLKARPEQTGSKLKCPKCGKVVAIPKAPPEDAVELP